MLSRRTISFLLVLTALGGLSACKKKKPVLPPPQAQVPNVIFPLPEPLPPPTTAPEPNRPEPQNVPVADSKPPQKKHPRVAKKPTTPPATADAKPSQTQPPPQRPAEDTTLTATNSPQEALHQQVNTTQLLDATENNLKSLNRSLNNDEQAVVQHIRSYMQQSRSALDQKDYERAYNLANKARLLSDELIKH